MAEEGESVKWNEEGDRKLKNYERKEEEFEEGKYRKGRRRKFRKIFNREMEEEERKSGI